MAKTKVSEWDAVPGNNTDIDSINIAEGCAPSGINNAIRELMSQVKDFQQGTYSDPFNGPVNGTIGATTPATGAFTTLAASGAVTLSGGTANGVPYLNGSKVLTSGSALTFDGSNLGLGVTPSAWGGNFKALESANGNSFASYIGGGASTMLAGNTYHNGTNWIYKTSTYATLFSAESDGAYRWRTSPSGTAGNAISFTQAMTLDASGNLQLGMTNGSFSGTRSYINSASSSATAGVELFNAGTRNGYIFSNGSQIQVGSASSIPLVFATVDTERARIDSSGRFLVNTSSSIGGDSKICVVGPATANQQQITCHNPSTSGTRLFIAFGTEASYTERGWIQWNGTTMALTNASDSRLKENIVDAPSALSKIAAIQIRSFDFKENGRHVDYGVVAQELKEVLPEAVFEGSDNEDGSINKPWSVGLEPVIPVLVKALQDMKQIVDAQAARIAALEAK